MAVTQNSYTGDGSKKSYSFTFPYLKAADVKCSIDATVTTAFTLANATTVQFNTAPANNAKIKIYRETDDAALPATFYTGSAIKSEDLNDNFTQNLYSTQEVTARYLSNLGGTMTGDLHIGEDAVLTFEGATDDAYETTLTVTDPTADRTITFPNVTGTVVTTGDTASVTSAMIHDSTIVNADINANAEIAVSKLADGAARQLLQTNAAGDSVEWTSNIDIPGTLDVTGAVDFDSNLTVDGTAIITHVDINGGAIDGTIIGANSAAAGTFTNGTIATADINGGAIDGTTIGASSASTGAFTTLTTSGNTTVSGVLTSGDFQLSGSSAVASDLTPKVHANYDLGNSTTRWQNCYFNNVYSNGSTLHNSTTIGQNNTTTLTLNSKVGSDIVPTGTRDIGASDAKWNKVWTTDLDVTNGQLNTLGGMQSGTASVLAGTDPLDATLTEINTICDGKGVQTTISDSDAHYPTSGAVIDYVAAQIAPLGGLEVIANEDSFPTQPASGVVVSIADAGGIVVNGSGVSTTARTSGNGSDNVTINGFPSTLHSTTLADSMGLLVSSTGSSNTYTYHKLLGKEDDIKNLSDDINDFNARYRVASSAPGSNNDDGDLYFDTSTKKMKVYNAATSQWDDVAQSSSSYIVTLSESFNGTLQDFTMSTAATDAQSTIVSINGVIQKPNAGTSTPSEGFAISGNTLKLAAAPPTGSDYFVVVLGDTVSIGTPSDNTVSTDKIQNLAVITGKIAADAVDGTKIADDAVGAEHIEVLDGDLKLADGQYLDFGDGGLKIRTNSNNAYIQEATSGKLAIQGSNIEIANANASATYIYCTDGGAVTLYHNNSPKLETRSDGVALRGTIQYVEGLLRPWSATGVDLGTDSDRWRDIYVYNDIDIKDYGEIRIGNDDDLKIYHDTSDSIIHNNVSGKHLRITNHDDSDSAVFYNGSSVNLYYAGNKKLETTNDGAKVTGYVFAHSNISDSYYTTQNKHVLQSDLSGGVSLAVEHSHDSNPYGIVVYFSDVTPDDNTQYFLNCTDSTGSKAKIYSDGDVWTSDAGTLTSDQTLKENITDATSKLEDLKKIKVRNFNWKSSFHPEKYKKKQIGFIAQEVETVFPALISEHDIAPGMPDDGHTPVMKKAIKDAWAPILVKALQEAITKIETLETKVAALEAK